MSATATVCGAGWPFGAFAVNPAHVSAVRTTVDETAGDAGEHGEEAALVAATLGGDEGAFGELVRRHKHRIFGLVTRFARDTHEREDLCQEIFLQAYRKLGHFRGEAPFGHWLSRLAVRKCYDHLRRTRHARQSEVGLDESLYPVEDHAAGRAQEAREAREILARALARLPADDRLVITLLELEDCPVRDIAALTNWSETNVRTRAYRARAALKKILAEQNASFS